MLDTNSYCDTPQGIYLYVCYNGNFEIICFLKCNLKVCTHTNFDYKL